MNTAFSEYAVFADEPEDGQDWECSLVPRLASAGGYTCAGRTDTLQKFVTRLKQNAIPVKEPASFELLLRLLKAGVRVMDPAEFTEEFYTEFYRVQP